MDCIAQPQDIGIRRHDGETRAPVAILDHGPVYKHALLGAKLEHKPAHAAPPSPFSPRMIARLTSISGATSAPSRSTLPLCCRVNSAREMIRPRNSAGKG